MKNDSIALFGTSANPPTYGHQAILESLLPLFPKVVTWASDNPFKAHGIPLNKRCQLLKLLVNEINNPKIQIVQELSSPWAISTIKKANQIWPSHSFTFVIGSDLTEQISSWLNANEVLTQVRIAIAPRENWPINSEQIKKLERLGGKIDILPISIPNTSSSKIRDEKEFLQVPNIIRNIVIEQNLYGSSRNIT